MMNICFQFCFHIRLLTRWQHVTPHVYGLHPSMLTKYVILVNSGDHIDAKPIRVLIVKITKLKKL
jgi:hypothetical protein